LLVALLALGGCAARGVLHDFTTDSCSLFPDRGTTTPACWADCCVMHDRAYWRGGTASEREAADAQLRACVLARTGKPMFSGLMYWGVRGGGVPVIPTGYRWGYGWSYGRGYEALTASEQRQAEERFAAYRPASPDPGCKK
jgi:hypothetical protein